MNVLVIDVGSSSMRGVLFNGDGTILWRRQVEYQPRFVSDVWVEQPPEDWLYALVDICTQAADQEVDAISITSQRSSVLLVDGNGRALCPAMMWQDQRCEEMRSLTEEKRDVLTDLTGARFNTVYSGPKMAWFIRHEPALVERACKLCTIADYLLFHMTGRWVTDESYASRTLLMNLRTRQWDDRLLDMFHIPRQKLCQIVAPACVVGPLTEAFAQRTALRKGIPVVTAGGDQQCGALGQGLYREGRASLTMGTGAYLVCVTPDVPAHLTGDVVYGAHAVPKQYLPEYGLLTCGSVHRWLLRTLFSEEPQDQAGYARVNEMIAQSPIGAGGCLALPFFQGTGSPDWDPNKRGAFSNLSLGTTRADMARAMLESLAYAMRDGLDLLRQRFGEIGQISVSGGLTRCDCFMHLLTDVLETPLVYDCAETEHTAMGAWMNAAVTLSLAKDLQQAEAMAHRNEQCITLRPDPHNVREYRTAKRSFDELAKRLS